MTLSYTTSGTETFTIAHAREIASRVATDLKRVQRFYGAPSDAWIDAYEAELIHLLKNDVVGSVVYGYKRNEKWTAATLRYTALPGGVLSTNDDPGKILPGVDISGATFSSFLTYNARWIKLSAGDRAAIEKGCPFQRSEGVAPSLEAGYWVDDHKYTAGGRGLGRSTVRL